MTAHLTLLAIAAVGHLCLFVAVVNRSHGLTTMPVWMDRIVVAVALGFVLGSVGGGLWLAVHPWEEFPTLVKGYLLACAGVGGLVLPAITLARHLRAVPPGIHGSSRTIDLAAEHGANSMIGDGPRAWWLRIPGNDSLRLRVNHWRVSRDDLPAELDGLSILHVSDLHFARTYRREFFDRVRDVLVSERVDLALFTGDLIDEPETLSWIDPFLSPLRGTLGSYAILGNHDSHHDLGAIREEIARSGFQTIDGRWTTLDACGVRLAIGGNTAPWGPRPGRGTMPAADFSILLSHSPDQFRWGTSEGIDLIFSGHNHGGQVRLPVLGPVLMPSLYGRRYDWGFFQRKGTLLYSNQGVGAKHPLRWNCLPEVALFELRAARRPVSRSGEAPRFPDDRLSSTV